MKTMFEEINKRRQEVQENIQKAFEVGFTGGDDLEKAHQVGDIHPNGKWVWTQLPSGKYDWRVMKKTSGSSASAPQKNSVSQKHDELKGFVNIVKQTPNERHFEDMDDAQLKRFRDFAHRCSTDKENLNKLTRERCAQWRDLAKEEIGYRSSHKDDSQEKANIPSTALRIKKAQKTSTFVNKTFQTVKEYLRFGYNVKWTPEKEAKIKEALTDNEAVAKQIINTTFPASEWDSLMATGKSIQLDNGDKLIFYNTVRDNTTSRNPYYAGSKDYRFSIVLSPKTGSERTLAQGSINSRSKWSKPSEKKVNCKISALISYLHLNRFF